MRTIYVPCMYESWILDEMPVIAQGPTDGGWSPCLKVFDLRNTLCPLAVAHFLHLGTFTQDEGADYRDKAAFKDPT